MQFILSEFSRKCRMIILQDKFNIYKWYCQHIMTIGIQIPQKFRATNDNFSYHILKKHKTTDEKSVVSSFYFLPRIMSHFAIYLRIIETSVRFTLLSRLTSARSVLIFTSHFAMYLSSDDASERFTLSSPVTSP